MLIYWITTYSRYMSYSGFIIVGLTTFVMGMNDSLCSITRKTYLFFLLFLFGGFVLFPVFWGMSFRPEWDIYQFFILTVILIIGLRRLSDKVIYYTGLLGFILLWIPFWQWEYIIQDLPLVHEILLGICGDVKMGTWPILPWLGLPVMSYALGYWCKQNLEKLKSWQNCDWLFLPLLILSIPNAVVHYRYPDVGPNFYCYVNRAGPVAFWSTFIWVYFFMRISLLTNINKILQNTILIKHVSKMQLSQNFALFYLVQIGYLSLMSMHPIFKSQHHYGIGIFMCYATIPIVEGLVYFIKKIYLSFKK